MQCLVFSHEDSKNRFHLRRRPKRRDKSLDTEDLERAHEAYRYELKSDRQMTPSDELREREPLTQAPLRVLWVLAYKRLRTQDSKSEYDWLTNQEIGLGAGVEAGAVSQHVSSLKPVLGSNAVENQREAGFRA